MHVSGNHHVEVEATISFFYFIFYFFALVSEEPSLQCMCNVCTIQQHISSSEMELGYWVWNFDPWPDPTQTLFDPLTRPGHRVSVLWIERLFWRRCATSECFLPKVSVLCSTHTDHKNFQHNCKFIQYWKVKTRNSAIADKPRNTFRLEVNQGHQTW